MPAKNGSPRNLTRTKLAAERSPSWSPDGKWIAYFSDATGESELFITQSDGAGETKSFHRDPTAEKPTIAWSHNNEWIAYALNEDVRTPQSVIWVYNVIDGTKRKLTSGFFNDDSPVFDRKGDFLYFSSSRAYNAPKYEDSGTTFIYSGTQVLMAMPLRSDVKISILAESDEESTSME